MHGAGRQLQSKLKRIAERIVAEGQCVMDAQRGDPDRRRPGGRPEHACRVLLCTLQRAAFVVYSGDGPQEASCGGS